VKGGEKACDPAVTRRKDNGRMTVRPLSFQRDKCVLVRPRNRTKEQRLRTPRRVATPSWPTSCWPEEAHGPPSESVRLFLHRYA